MALGAELNYHSRKRFLGTLTAISSIFGIAGTTFGITNSVMLADINTKLAENSKKTDLLMDVQAIYKITFIKLIMLFAVLTLHFLILYNLVHILSQPLGLH